MRRRLLLALIGLGGAGAALAQVPPTFSVAGAALVEAVFNLPEPTVQGAVGGYDTKQAGTKPRFGVTWQEPGEPLYVGEMEISHGYNWLDDAFKYFYTRTCMTLDKSRCGRLEPEPNERSSGSSLDEWWRRVNGPVALNVDDIGDWFGAPPSAPHSVSFYCSNGTRRYEQGAITYFDTQTQVRQYVWYRRRSDQNWAQTALVSVGAIQTNAGTYAVAQCGVPTIAEWAVGNYYQYEGEPSAHPDVWGGVAVVAAEVQAEYDRVYYGLHNGLAPGLTWDPVPSTAQLGPGGGGTAPGDGGEVDPGTCEDGWFLTQVVCEIRTFSANTWQFLSHDAWVPETGFEQRWGSLHAEAVDRFPFTVMAQFPNVMPDGEVGGNPYDGQQEELACAGWEVDMHGMGGLVGIEDARGTIQLCGTPVGDWLRDYGRGLMYYFFFFALSVSFFLTVVRA